MARRKKVAGSIDIAQVKSTLLKAGVSASDVAELTSGLVQKVALGGLMKEKEELSGRLKEIDAQIAALTGGRARTRTARKAVTGRKAKRGPRKASTDAVLSALQQSKGTPLRREELAEKMGVKSASLKSALTTLLAEKQIKKKGQKRGTSYYV
jgi:hypothetical protein